MPVRPLASPDSALEEQRPWVWPDGTRLPRFDVSSDSAARRTSLRFIRELRLWDRDRDELLTPYGGDPPLCDDEDMIDDTAGPSGADAGMDADTPVPQPLQPSSIFREGAVFRGSQRVTRANRDQKQDDWGVVVIIHEIDLARGRCSGDMMAENVPQAPAPVITHWEGEVVDGLNNSFVTCKWGASYSIDIGHWRKFAAFAPLYKSVIKAHGRYNRLHECSHIFMRWKESFFVNESNERSTLTIAGFYYCCLSRETGKIEGYYFDPHSTPNQKLELEPESELPCFTSYSFA